MPFQAPVQMLTRSKRNIDLTDDPEDQAQKRPPVDKRAAVAKRPTPNKLVTGEQESGDVTLLKAEIRRLKKENKALGEKVATLTSDKKKLAAKIDNLQGRGTKKISMDARLANIRKDVVERIGERCEKESVSETSDFTICVSVDASETEVTSLFPEYGKKLLDCEKLQSGVLMSSYRLLGVIDIDADSAFATADEDVEVHIVNADVIFDENRLCGSLIFFINMRVDDSEDDFDDCGQEDEWFAQNGF